MSRGEGCDKEEKGGLVVAKHWSVPLWVKGGDKTGARGWGKVIENS